MRKLGFILMFALGVTACSTVDHDQQEVATFNQQNIWFYRTNSRAQQTVLTAIKGTREPGCHNFFVESRIHRAAVTGYQYCELYAAKDCQAGTILSAQWVAKRVKTAEKKQPTTKLTKGSRWVFDREGNIKARSWRCVE